jgi:zinc transporter 1
MEGLISVHELHVWQLSDTKIIASLHVLLKSRQTYMTLGSDIRKVFHKYGIHSATIQPEFIDDKSDSKVSLGEVENSDSIMNIDVRGK